MRFARFLVIVFAIFLACGRESNPKLEDIDVLCDNDPRLAMSMLDSIDPQTLSKRDRHRYDLLSIKSRDKAYVSHTSDSLILDVIDYYETHQDQGHYPEALYYGGRVYSDIGDLPTALEYFQKAIDATPDDEEHMRLKSSVLSQTGRLLESLRLHKQASPYIAKAIEISTQLKDSVNIFYDAMLLAYIYKHREEYDLARHQLYIAKKFAPDMPIEDKEWWDIEYASILQHEGKNDSSLMIINRLPNITDSLYKNYVFGVTADIYKTTEKIDSAYHYAKKLALSSDFTNRFAGFKILFSPEVFLSIPKDSIAFFARAYGKYIDAYLNRYESQDALYQNSKYNYSIHQRDKEKILKEKIKTEKDLKIAYVVAAGCVLLLLIIVFRLKYNSIKNEILLHRALHLINSLELDNKLNFVHHRNEVNRDVSQNIKRIEYNNQRTTSTHNSSLQDTLRKELLERLQYVSSDHIPEPILDEQIVESLIVKKLHKLLSENKGIKYNDTDLWISIEKEVLKSTPEFKTKLMTLSLGKMNNKEYQVALLIRCGFKPKEISDLIMRGKSAATDRRRFLTKKIFGESGTIRELDRIILRL